MYMPGNLISGSCSFGDHFCHFCDILRQGKAYECRKDEHRGCKLKHGVRAKYSNASKHSKAQRYDLFPHNAEDGRAEILWI